MSLEVSKAVVLRARELLTPLPSTRRLTREQFITVCLNASKRFLRDHNRASPPHLRGGTPRGGRDGVVRTPRGSGGGGGAASSVLSGRQEYLLTQLLQSETDMVLQSTVAGGDNAVQETTAVFQPPPPMLGLSSIRRNNEEPQGFVTPTQNSSAHRHRNTADQATSDRQRKTPPPPVAAAADHVYTALHPLHVAAATHVKQTLDPIYARGLLTREQYSDAVITILTEGFHLLRGQELAMEAAYDDGDDSAYGESDDCGGGSFRSCDAVGRRDPTTERGRNTKPLPDMLRAVLDDLSKGIVVHYESEAMAHQHTAFAVAHEARRQTHAASIRAHHRSPAGSVSPRREVAALTTVIAPPPLRTRSGEVGGGAVHATTTVVYPDRSTSNRSAEDTLSAAEDEESRSHQIIEEEERVFDSHVAQIKQMLSLQPTSSAAASPAVPASDTAVPASDASTVAPTNGGVCNDDVPRKRAARRSALEVELRMLQVEMDTLALRTGRIREELALLGDDVAVA